MVFRSTPYSAASRLTFSPRPSRVSSSSTISGFNTGTASTETGPVHPTAIASWSSIPPSTGEGGEFQTAESGEFEMSADIVDGARSWLILAVGVVAAIAGAVVAARARREPPTQDDQRRGQ